MHQLDGTDICHIFHIDYSTFLLLSDGACETGSPITSRQRVDDPNWTMVSPDQRFLCNGQVTAWQYLGQNSNAFRAIVWRPINTSATQFRIVGINNIPAGAVNTPVTYTIPENQRISVKAGDVIGWSFGDSVLPYNFGGANRVRYLKGNLNGSLTNQVLDINFGVWEREYSIAATVVEVREPGE